MKCWKKLLYVLGIVEFLFAPLTSFAHEELFRWKDPNPSPSPVVGFRAHFGTSPGNYTTVIDVGLPMPNVDDIYSSTINVGDEFTIYIVMTALDVDGLESIYSNEQRRCVETYGDFNNDGAVSITDFILFAMDFVLGHSRVGTDMNCDGTVSIADFRLFATQFGRIVKRKE